MLLFSGTSNQPLAQKIAELKKTNLAKIQISKFADNETYINIQENIKNQTIYIIQSCSTPANEYFMELLIIINAIKRLKPKQIIVILPFYPYRRQEKLTQKGESISAQLVARLLETLNINKIITLDLHSSKITQFFKIPCENLTTLPLFVDYFKSKKLKNFIVVSPDQGALTQNKLLAKFLNLNTAFFKKSRRGLHDQISYVKLIGQVKNKNVIMLDDEISTAGTLEKTVNALKSAGAKNIYFAATHGVLVYPAINRIQKSKLKELIITDSINIPKEKKIKKIKVLSIAPIIADILT